MGGNTSKKNISPKTSPKVGDRREAPSLLLEEKKEIMLDNPKLYCGNNRNDEKLMNGTHIIGTRFECFQNGVGKGRSMPCDPAYRREYDPIDKTKTYCGKGLVLPEGYDRYGSNQECLRKGFGRGMKESCGVIDRVIDAKKKKGRRVTKRKKSPKRVRKLKS